MHYSRPVNKYSKKTVCVLCFCSLHSMSDVRHLHTLKVNIWTCFLEICTQLFENLELVHFFLMNTFIYKDAINWQKNRQLRHLWCYKDLFISNTVNTVSLYEKNILVFTKLLSSSTLLIIIKLLEHQISILEWFLKDHVTRKTGIMTAENSSQKLILL